MSQTLVKIVTLVVVAIVIAFCSARGADEADSDGLMAFWRTVFVRPGLDEIARTVAASPQMVGLGRALFHDPRLSGQGARSCSSCHMPERGFSDGRALAQGLDGRALVRNAPTLYNLGWGHSFNWDGSASSLETQAAGPIEHLNEMGGTFSQVVERLHADESMRTKFAAAFPREPDVSRETVVAALAAYVRSLVSPITRFDQWVAGNDAVLSRDELVGFRIFVGKGGCVGCHAGWRFSDEGFHDIGLARSITEVDSADAGKKGVMAFKTPTLRALNVSAPYMHDGSFDNLEAVVTHYASDVSDRKGLSEILERRIELTDREKSQLVAFLKTL